MIGAGLFCSFHKKLGNTLCVAEFFVIGELYYQVQLPSIFGSIINVGVARPKGRATPNIFHYYQEKRVEHRRKIL